MPHYLKSLEVTITSPFQHELNIQTANIANEILLLYKKLHKQVDITYIYTPPTEIVPNRAKEELLLSGVSYLN